MSTPLNSYHRSGQKRSSAFSSSMAASKSQKPSSSNPVHDSRYDIFLSFRGLDTRRKFTDHLYHALMRQGFETFRDDDEIERGFDIKPELLKAINSSRMSVIILSKNYSNSTACLFELQNILELCKKSDHFVLPVFYEVDPGDIKEQSKNLDFGRKKVAAEKVEGWTEALREVASMAGMVFRKDSDGHEAKFIEDIVAVLKSKLAGKCMMVDDYLVGMDSRTKHVDSWLKDRSTRFGTEVGILVICGMGGIGKTTIANVLYNSNQGRYDAACFLSNIRDVAKGPDGLLRLQRQLISTLIRKEERKVRDVDDGRRRMKYSLTNKRVLLVLDDVDHKDHLTALAGQPDWFTPGSKMIITTRLENLVKADDYEVYRPEKLSTDDSLELFNWHAIGQKHPIQKGHMDLSKKFVRHCDGLPLALEVLGSSVRRKSLDVWESALQKLAATCDGTILEKLEISYDSLKDDDDKNIFLDIACFFAQKKKSDTITILQGCGYYALAGIHNLADRNLLTIKNEKLEMHQLLQDMGKQIVRRESRFPEKRSRIWHHMDSFSILSEKIGTGKIRGLILDMNMLTNSNTVFEANTFEKIFNLRLLKLSGVQLSGTHWAFPKRLGWLYWRGFPLESFPSDIPLEKLVYLDLRYSNLKRVWEGAKALGSLKILNLSHSPRLENTPDFSGIPNLEKLILKACPSLFEVDESILKLQKIVFLNLRDCKNLKKLPSDIFMLESLVEINISGCSNLMGAIVELGKMKSLQVLQASRMGIHHFLGVIPKSRTQMSLASLPTSLTHLNLSHCNLTENAFRGDFSNLSKLKQLFLVGNPFTSLPKAIKDLTGLQILDLSWCPKLKQILFPPIGLEKLVVTECHALEKITYETSARIKSISHGACMSLDYVQDSFKILPVKEVDVELINQIGFFNLDFMANFEAYIVNLRVWSRKKCPIQILQEGPIFSTYFPGKEVPRWFSNKNRGPTVSLTMTSSSHGRGVPGMNLCLVYTVPEIDWLPEPLEVEVINKSRGIKRSYTPRCYSIPEAGGDIVWLSHWLPFFFGTAIFEEGDELQVLFNLKVDGQIKECGVHLLWIREDEVQKYNNTIYHSWDSNMFRVVISEEEAGVGGGQATTSTAEDGGGGGGAIEDAEGDEREVTALTTMEMATDADDQSIKIEDDDGEMGSGKNMDPWIPSFRLALFIEVMEEEMKTNGSRDIGIFQPKSWERIRKTMIDKTKYHYDLVQLKNKFFLLCTLHTKYKQLCEQPGVGWCPQKGTVVAEPKIWEKLLKINDNAKHFKERGFPHFAAMSRILGDTTMTGSEAHPSVQSSSRTNSFDTSPQIKQENDDDEVGVTNDKSKKVFDMKNDQDCGESQSQLDECMEVLNGMDDLDGQSFTKGIKLLKNDPSWRPHFLKLSEQRKRDFLKYM